MSGRLCSNLSGSHSPSPGGGCDARARENPGAGAADEGRRKRQIGSRWSFLKAPKSADRADVLHMEFQNIHSTSKVRTFLRGKPFKLVLTTLNFALVFRNKHVDSPCVPQMSPGPVDNGNISGLYPYIKKAVQKKKRKKKKTLILM